MIDPDGEIIKTPMGDVLLNSPLTKPGYSLMCRRCDRNVGGGFVRSDVPVEEDKADQLKRAICPFCRTREHLYHEDWPTPPQGGASS